MLSTMVLRNRSPRSIPTVVMGIVLIGLLQIGSVAEANNQRTWSVTISAEPANSVDRAHGFTLYSVDQGKLHLTGTWWYENGAVRNETPPRVVIEGRRTSDGVFWPNVTLQVKDEVTGKWEPVARSSSEGRPATIIIEPNSRNFNLTVNLDAFKPLLGKYKLGRVVLNTDQASQFELKYLLPPGREGESKKRRRKALEQECAGPLRVNGSKWDGSKWGRVSTLYIRISKNALTSSG